MFRFDAYVKDHPDIEPYKTSLITLFELLVVAMQSAMTWDDIIARSDASGAEGDRLMNWKERGYSTIFDILMVSLIIVENK